jgi:hypothetical protein
MTNRTRWTAVVTLAGLLITTFAAAPAAVYASEKGRKNTALLLGGAAAYSLLKKKNTQGLILGAGALYAYKKYKDKKSSNRARAASRTAYTRGYRAGNRTRTVRYARVRR